MSSTAWALADLPLYQLVEITLESFDVDVRIYRPGEDQVAATLGAEMDTIVIDTSGVQGGYWLISAECGSDPEGTDLDYGLTVDCLDCEP